MSSSSDVTLKGNKTAHVEALEKLISEQPTVLGNQPAAVAPTAVAPAVAAVAPAAVTPATVAPATVAAVAAAAVAAPGPTIATPAADDDGIYFPDDDDLPWFPSENYFRDSDTDVYDGGFAHAEDGADAEDADEDADIDGAPAAPAAPAPTPAAPAPTHAAPAPVPTPALCWFKTAGCTYVGKHTTNCSTFEVSGGGRGKRKRS